ncbi:uncharacterized protein TNCV_4074651 [Trichonephila clavipes]|nr:uncharacterized protein TNCV_4074651 [Trichonephila clavipes]
MAPGPDQVCLFLFGESFGIWAPMSIPCLTVFNGEATKMVFLSLRDTAWSFVKRTDPGGVPKFEFFWCFESKFVLESPHQVVPVTLAIMTLRLPQPPHSSLKKSLESTFYGLYALVLLHCNDDHREDVSNFVQSFPGFQECDEEDVETWMACDAEDCGFQMLNDDEVVTSLQEESDPVDDETDEQQDNNNNECSRGSLNADVFSALETTVKWYEQQSECCSTQLLLKRIRDLAGKKRRCTMVQQKISDYFPQ